MVQHLKIWLWLRVQSLSEEVYSRAVIEEVVECYIIIIYDQGSLFMDDLFCTKIIVHYLTL